MALKRQSVENINNKEVCMSVCNFNQAWIGKCKKTDCSEHKDLKCCSCGEKATKSCDETMGLVCGAKLCDNCEHTIQSNGGNSGGELPEGIGDHCKKSEQKFDPWYMREVT